MNLGTLAGIGIFVILLIVAGKMFLGGDKSSSFQDLPELQIDQFLDNANSLRGNEYRVNGKVEDKLRWLTGRGQVVSLQVEQGGRTDFIPVEIPPEYESMNIEREQRYSFRVKFREGGIPVVTGIERL